MLGSIFKGMAGMLAYSKGLSNISGNVANMNTPGYKRTELHFRDLVYNKELSDQSGFQNTGAAGVDASLKSTVYSQGELRGTENDTDMAIEGNGFFVLRDGSNQFYTRVGQFEFNPDGYLVDKSFGYNVGGLNSGGRITNINIKDFRSTDPQATSFISLIGNLSVGSTTHTTSGVDVFDSEGAKHTLDIEFVNNGATTPRSWLATIKDGTGNVLANNVEIRFNANGSPAENFSQISFDLTSDDGRVSNVIVDLGEPGSFSQVTNFSGGATSTVELENTNGFGPGIMTGFTINELGEIEAEYSNDQTIVAATIALARFESPSDLIQEGGGLLSAQSFQEAIVGSSKSFGLGDIVGSSIELSNVDLTSQFTDMIVLQRGYQASSQVLTSSNEMLQQLIDATKSR